MELPLSKADAERLLEIIYLGATVINESREDDRLAEYDKLEQLMLKAAAESGARGVFFNTETNAYEYTGAFREGRVRKFREDHDDYVFWEELVDRLVHRDLERRNTVQKPDKPFAPGLDPAHDEIATEYWREFEEHGIDRLGIWEGM